VGSVLVMAHWRLGVTCHSTPFVRRLRGQGGEPFDAYFSLFLLLAGNTAIMVLLAQKYP